MTETHQKSDMARQFSPPCDIAAEMATLGSMLMERAALEDARAILTAQDFYRPGNQRIFTACAALADRGEAVDLITMQAELTAKGWFEQTGGMPYLTTLYSTVPVAANACHYAKIVRGKSVLRDIIATAQQGIKSAMEADDPAGCLAKFQAESSKIRSVTKPTATLLHPKMWEVNDEAREQAKSPKQTPGLGFGIRRLDAMTGGLHKGESVLVGARPSTGKTAFALGIAANVAVKERKRVLFFSTEMTNAQLAMRVACQVGRLNNQKVSRGELSPEEWQEFDDACNWTKGAILELIDANVSPSEIRAAVRDFIARYGGVELVVIDYLQRLRPDNSKGDRYQDTTTISDSIKTMAKDFDCCFLTLSQLTRASEKRDDKRPEVADLSDSGRIEADADVVLLLNNVGRLSRKKDNVPADENMVDEMEIIVGKQRNGEIGTVTVGFMPVYTKFVEVAGDYNFPTGF